jgi:hypothetical protein
MKAEFFLTVLILGIFGPLIGGVIVGLPFLFLGMGKLVFVIIIYSYAAGGFQAILVAIIFSIYGMHKRKLPFSIAPIAGVASFFCYVAASAYLDRNSFMSGPSNSSIFVSLILSCGLHILVASIGWFMVRKFWNYSTK